MLYPLWRYTQYSRDRNRKSFHRDFPYEKHRALNQGKHLFRSKSDKQEDTMYGRIIRWIWNRRIKGFFYMIRISFCIYVYSSATSAFQRTEPFLHIAPFFGRSMIHLHIKGLQIEMSNLSLHHSFYINVSKQTKTFIVLINDLAK